MPRQVMIEAVVASVTMTDNLTLGLRWNMGVNAHKLEIKPFSNPITAGGPLGFQGLSALASGFGYFATDSSGQVRLAIEADATLGKAKILSAPQILVADNREARIQVGTQIPIATSTTTTPNSTVATGSTLIPINTTTSTIQYKDVGTILKVKPQINDSGLISLEMSQEVSSASTQQVLGTDQFVISKNEVSTNLVAQDGETIVIGGLVNETDSNSRDGIPGLSRIPLLGYLFGKTTDAKQRQELIILLTPRVVRNQSEAEKMTSDYYELFKNVSKELNIEKHKKSTGSQKQSSEKAAPAAKEKVDAKASPSAAQKNSGKNGQSEYPLRSDD
jgi:general secretion pathway protein D